MRVLVTGAAGFTGTRMMGFLAAQRGITPVGLIRRHIPETGTNAGPFVTADLLDRDALHEAVTKIRPDAVIHLAGLTHGTPNVLQATNVTGTENLLDAVVSVNPDCRILVISSSAVYGYAGNLPIPETAPLQPVSDYGTSKVAQETLALNYGNRDAVIAIARPFNLAGPGQPESFVCGRIVKQVVEIEQRKRDALELREISTSRDLIDVRDVVRGYWALVTHPDFTSDCAGKAFNLGSGRSYAISEVITTLEQITGKTYKIQLPAKPMHCSIPSQQSDNARIHAVTGWTPTIQLHNSLSDMLKAARKLIE